MTDSSCIGTLDPKLLLGIALAPMLRGCEHFVGVQASACFEQPKGCTPTTRLASRLDSFTTSSLRSGDVPKQELEHEAGKGANDRVEIVFTARGNHATKFGVLHTSIGDTQLVRNCHHPPSAQVTLHEQVFETPGYGVH